MKKQKKDTEAILAQEIIRINYTKRNSMLAYSINKPTKWSYEFYSDGRCVKQTYLLTDDGNCPEETATIPQQRFYQLASELQEIFNTPHWEKKYILYAVLDGYRYDLEMCYTGDRKKCVSGGVGTGRVDELLEELIEEVFAKE